MRFAGIDIGGERHAVPVVNDGGALLVRSRSERRPRDISGCASFWVIQTPAW
jgi:hypothetical protein